MNAERFAQCCQQGRSSVWLEKGIWYVGDYGSAVDAVADILFCPHCGEFLLRPLGEEEMTRLLPFAVSITELGGPVRICFDVDGVLADHRGGKPYAEREPYPWVAPALRELKKAGHTLVMQTARYMLKFDGNQEKANRAGWGELKKWLDKYGIPYDEIYLGKCSADIYVDDKACRVESDRGIVDWFSNLMSVIERVQNHKKAA